MLFSLSTNIQITIFHTKSSQNQILDEDLKKKKLAEGKIPICDDFQFCLHFIIKMFHRKLQQNRLIDKDF